MHARMFGGEKERKEKILFPRRGFGQWAPPLLLGLQQRSVLGGGGGGGGTVCQKEGLWGALLKTHTTAREWPFPPPPPSYFALCIAEWAGKINREIGHFVSPPIPRKAFFFSQSMAQ